MPSRSSMAVAEKIKGLGQQNLKSEIFVLMIVGQLDKSLNFSVPQILFSEMGLIRIVHTSVGYISP